MIIKRNQFKILILILVASFFVGGNIAFAAGEAITLKSPLEVGTFEELIAKIANLIFWAAIIVAPLIIIIAGFLLVTAGGNIQQVAQAKKMILWAGGGLLIILLSSGIIYLITNILGVKMAEMDLVSNPNQLPSLAGQLLEFGGVAPVGSESGVPPPPF